MLAVIKWGIHKTIYTLTDWINNNNDDDASSDVDLYFQSYNHANNTIDCMIELDYSIECLTHSYTGLWTDSNSNLISLLALMILQLDWSLMSAPVISADAHHDNRSPKKN